MTRPSSRLPLAVLPGLLALLALAGCATPGRDPGATGDAAPRGKVNMAEDEAAAGPYGDAWATGDNGGGGFTPWRIDVVPEGDPASHAGVFIARPGRTGTPAHVLREGAAFGVYANGPGDERVRASRGLQAPMVVGDAFSVLVEAFHPGAPDAGGAPLLAVTLRAGREPDSPPVVGLAFDNAARRWRVVAGGLDVPAAGDLAPGSDETGAVVLSFARVGVATMDVEIHRLDGTALRRVPGVAVPAVAPLGLSFEVANNPGDVFFSGLQVNRSLGGLPTGRR